MHKIIKKEIKKSFKLNNKNIYLHTPILASLCMGVCLMSGVFFGNIKAGMTASMAALIVAYFPVVAPLSQRIITLLACSFTFIFSYSMGLIFSFNHLIISIALGIYAFCVHWTSCYLKLPPPKSFFFIMVAATASGIPYNSDKIPERIGLFAIGAIITSTLALIYSTFINKNTINDENNQEKILIMIEKDNDVNIYQALVFGLFMTLSLNIGFLLKIENPYWITVTCAAVMQGVSAYHIWQRVLQRVIGTFLGLGLCWCLLLLSKEMFIIFIFIIILQFVVEVFIPINYAIAVIFITPLSILLAEASDAIINNANVFIITRISNTVIGSLIGVIGGWILHKKTKTGD